MPINDSAEVPTQKMQTQKMNTILCPCCNKLVYSLKEKRNEETREPMLACEDCWDLHDKYWYYLSKFRAIPKYKGIKNGQKVWCNVGFNRNIWNRGIVNKIYVVNTPCGNMYIYECFIEDIYLEDSKIDVDMVIIDEDDIRYRHAASADCLGKLELDYEIDESKLHSKLTDNVYVDEL